MRLAERVREMEQQNQLLRRQLSVSQNQLIQAWGNNEGDDTADAPEQAEDQTLTDHKCKDKVVYSSTFGIFFMHLVISI